MMGIDINIRDKKLSSPLHWAAFSASESALGYILALDPDVNVQDYDGLTPLHLAIRSAEELRSTRMVKHLLIRGASRDIRDNNGRLPADVADEISFPELREEIKDILEPPSALVELFMIRTPMKKLNPSLRPIILYIILVSFV